MKNLEELVALVAELGKAPEALNLLKGLTKSDITQHSEEWKAGRTEVLSRILPTIIESGCVAEDVRTEASTLLREIAKSLA